MSDKSARFRSSTADGSGEARARVLIIENDKDNPLLRQLRLPHPPQSPFQRQGRGRVRLRSLLVLGQRPEGVDGRLPKGESRGEGAC